MSRQLSCWGLNVSLAGGVLLGGLTFAAHAFEINMGAAEVRAALDIPTVEDLTQGERRLVELAPGNFCVAQGWLHVLGTATTSENSDNEAIEQAEEGNMVKYIGIGVLAGTLIGLALDDIGLWIVLATSLGAAFACQQI